MNTTSTVAASAVFEARQLTKVYHMGEVDVHALRGVDLDLFESEFGVILGPSGSGKSTLLNILGGLDVPSSGTVRYRDHLLTDADDRALTQYRREHVGFVFQFYNLIPSLTALENVQLVTDIATRPFPAEDALGVVGLGDRLHHFLSQLSGGELQIVGIALTRCFLSPRESHSCRRRRQLEASGHDNFRRGAHQGRAGPRRRPSPSGRGRDHERRRALRCGE